VGASGTGPFDNDSAEDFCDELREADADEALELIRSTLLAAVDVPEGAYLQRDLGEAAVAASAVAVAARLGREEVLREADVDSSVPQIPDDIFQLVIAAARRVVQDDSEARRLWDQVGAGEEWAQIVDSLASDARGISS
jgi:hypothetical protein